VEVSGKSLTEAGVASCTAVPILSNMGLVHKKSKDYASALEQ
jgi:hypothetical protein